MWGTAKGSVDLSLFDHETEITQLNFSLIEKFYTLMGNKQIRGFEVSINVAHRVNKG